MRLTRADKVELTVGYLAALSAGYLIIRIGLFFALEAPL